MAQTVVIPLYPDFDLLDVAGPFGFFNTAGMDTLLAAPKEGLVKSLEGVELKAQAFSKMPAKPDVLWIPGGASKGYRAQFNNENPLLPGSLHSRTLYVLPINAFLYK